MTCIRERKKEKSIPVPTWTHLQAGKFIAMHENGQQTNVILNIVIDLASVLVADQFRCMIAAKSSRV